MNTKMLDAIANAVLYEGYMLYPYRPSSAKNRQRFNFGVLYPRSYSEAQSGSDAWSMQTEFLVQGCSLTRWKFAFAFCTWSRVLIHRLARRAAGLAGGRRAHCHGSGLQSRRSLPVAIGVGFQL